MYIAGGKGFAVFDVNSPLEPRRIGDIILTGALSWGGGAALCLQGKDYLYFAGGNGLVVMSLKDPTKPWRIGDVIDTGALGIKAGVSLKLMEDEAHGEQLLYIAGGKGLAVYGLADPARPRQVCAAFDTGCISLLGGVSLADAGGPECLLLAGGSGLAVLDTEDRRKPRVKRTVDTGLLGWKAGARMAVSGDGRFMYLAGGKGLGVFAMPGAQALLAGEGPKLLGKVATGALSHDSDSGLVFGEGHLDGGLLYVAGGKGLAIVDLTKLPGASNAA